MKALASLAMATALSCSSPVIAEILPQPGPANPRLQTVRWQPGETVLLTTMPESALTVMLEPGERISSAIVNDAAAWQVSITPEEDSFQIVSQDGASDGSITVTTDRREYRFALRTDRGLTAAYLVRFEFAELPPVHAAPMVGPVLPANAPFSPGAFAGPRAAQSTAASWQVRGDPAVRPANIADDGAKITITYGPEQALPAVFAIGPTGGEEVVNGYWRGEAFVIDRVHEELVFRIDKDKATAKRTVARK